ncbi:diaminopimelate decarboxylase [Streptomyces zingiberis]|uniref:Diaminopimelate decarboxylase n=1 Tax=Streptomyces zingiberis TaxID=2053010 RepID=A0ABX1C2A8_9ACTN|nr:diaminopimelate decarboxylase [Streptomyces zingiberis]NJQ02743.1 diaminopimelate decarboxylase [Streptomyces zingiberis]
MTSYEDGPGRPDAGTVAAPPPATSPAPPPVASPAASGRNTRPGGGAAGAGAADGPPAVPGTPARAAGDTAAAATAAASAARRDRAVWAAVRQGLVGPAEPVAGLLDVAGIRASAAALHAAFAEVTAPGTPVLHSFAVKAAPLVPVLRLLAAEGLGCEVASPGELALARAAGVPASHVVLDSPAKSEAELREALALGIAVNADNAEELSRLDSLVGGSSLVGGASGAPRGPLGIRVNPQVGGGSIAAMSTATGTSKFGVALRDEGARDWLVRAAVARPWLTRLHAHTGSQGIPLDLMVRGVRELYELAEEINAAAGERRITSLDLGGGLPVNFTSDQEHPSHRDYARALRSAVPGLFEGRYGLVTEFGRSLLAKHGTVLARVEYTKSSGGRPIAVTHAGAQLATRTVFAPDSWPLRVAAYDAAGRPRTGPEIAQDVAGPCCFAGDLVARERPLPLLASGDLVALLDTGAYYFSNHFAYNSLPRPAVYGFAEEAVAAEAAGDPEAAEAAGEPGETGAPARPDGTAAPDGTVTGGGRSASGGPGGDPADGGGRTAEAAPGGVRFALVRPAQRIDEIVAESGGDHREALLGL